MGQKAWLGVLAFGSVLGCASPQARPALCDEALHKAVLMVGPLASRYTTEARARGIEGRVRVMLTVTRSGFVANPRVIQSVGYGLDEACIEAVRSMTFEPATLCGVTVSSEYVTSMRFVLAGHPPVSAIPTPD